ncbi:hypothetical protein EGI22_15610, partial [Lacihabitans sp. LS3-19]|uniref:hypothetical protein n=1 Tax=Lacihabitans sp. LS3-19 TaxID=2487335 RepID=UPI0020CE9E6C
SAQINVAPIENTTYTVTCKNSCDAISKSVNITVVPGIDAPNISTSKLNYCFGETITIAATNCVGNVIWSNGMIGANIEISASTNFSISAKCQTTECQSPQSQTLNIKVYPVLTPGSIAENTSTNCAGFNPLTIASIQNPSGGMIQWQKAEDCSAANPTWVNISGENTATFNPPALLVSTCYRRMAFDSCNSVYSNITTFNINPDPSITIMADTDSVCFGNTLNLTKTVIGGEGICDIQWQINKTSSSQSSTNWKNISVSDALAFNFNNPGNDSTFYFRARVDCINSSCNIATSNVVSAVFHPQLSISVPFSDSTICAGANVNILSSSCKGEILWSSGETSAQINVSPTENTTYTVTCKNSCDAVSESVNIKVVPGIEGPINTTPDSVYSPSALIFTANGQSLKWYESAISSIPLSQTPEVTIPGLYTFWVSQTIGICESPRIQITARLIPELAIVTQPLSLINCYGNTSNFEISALGGDLIYQWQRKRPNETAFSNLDDANNYIDGALTEQLKIKSVGNAESPNGTLYRCIINNQIEEIISEEVSLNVNRVQGSLPNQKLCLGNDLNFNLNNTHTITGIPSVIQWQYRTGTGADWLDLADGGSISGTNSLQMSITELTKANEFQYRCSLLFNSSTGTCTETTDL